MATAFLSKPAPRPIGLEKSWPNARVASIGSSGGGSRPGRPNRRAHNARLCAVSGSIRCSRGNAARRSQGIIAIGYAHGRGVLKGRLLAWTIRRGEGGRDVEQTYLETCCRSALHRLWLSRQFRTPRREQGWPVPAAAGRLGLAAARGDARYEMTSVGINWHCQVIDARRPEMMTLPSFRALGIERVPAQGRRVAAARQSRVPTLGPTPADRSAIRAVGKSAAHPVDGSGEPQRLDFGA